MEIEDINNTMVSTKSHELTTIPESKDDNNNIFFNDINPQKIEIPTEEISPISIKPSLRSGNDLSNKHAFNISPQKAQQHNDEKHVLINEMAESLLQAALIKEKKTHHDAQIIYSYIKDFSFFKTFKENLASDMDTDALIEICKSLKYEYVPKGIFVFKEGDLSNDKLYMILSGYAMVVKKRDENIFHHQNKQKLMNDYDEAIAIEEEDVIDDLIIDPLNNNNNKEDKLLLKKRNDKGIIGSSGTATGKTMSRISSNHSSYGGGGGGNISNLGKTNNPSLNNLRLNDEDNLEEFSKGHNNNATPKISTPHVSSTFKLKLKTMYTLFGHNYHVINEYDELDDQLKEKINETGVYIHKLTKGEMFGEKALTSKAKEPKRSTSILTAVDCEFLVLLKMDIALIMNKYDKERQNKYKYLKENVPYLDGLASKTMDDYYYRFKNERFIKDSVIIKQDQNDDKIYFIYQGECILTKIIELNFNTHQDNQFDIAYPAKEKFIIGKAGVGTIIGEEIIYDKNKKYHFNAIVTSSELLAFSFTKKDFMEWLPQETRNALKRKYYSKQRYHENKLNELIQKRIPTVKEHQEDPDIKKFGPLFNLTHISCKPSFALQLKRNSMNSPIDDLQELLATSVQGLNTSPNAQKQQQQQQLADNTQQDKHDPNANFTNNNNLFLTESINLSDQNLKRKANNHHHTINSLKNKINLISNQDPIISSRCKSSQNISTKRKNFSPKLGQNPINVIDYINEDTNNNNIYSNPLTNNDNTNKQFNESISRSPDERPRTTTKRRHLSNKERSAVAADSLKSLNEYSNVYDTKVKITTISPEFSRKIDDTIISHLDNVTKLLKLEKKIPTGIELEDGKFDFGHSENELELKRKRLLKAKRLNLKSTENVNNNNTNDTISQYFRISNNDEDEIRSKFRLMTKSKKTYNIFAQNYQKYLTNHNMFINTPADSGYKNDKSLSMTNPTTFQSNSRPNTASSPFFTQKTSYLSPPPPHSASLKTISNCENNKTDFLKIMSYSNQFGSLISSKTTPNEGHRKYIKQSSIKIIKPDYTITMNKSPKSKQTFGTQTQYNTQVEGDINKKDLISSKSSPIIIGFPHRHSNNAFDVSTLLTTHKKFSHMIPAVYQRLSNKKAWNERVHQKASLASLSMGLKKQEDLNIIETDKNMNKEREKSKGKDDKQILMRSMIRNRFRPSTALIKS